MISKADKMEDKEFVGTLKKHDLEVEDFTCLLCMSNESCEYSFDLYNVNGDCLCIK